MGRGRPYRLAAAAAATFVTAIAAWSVIAAGPAQASTTISINSGNVPTTAVAFPTHECSSQLGGGPLSGQDIWVFNLPGEHKITGDFVSVTATFSTPSGSKTYTIPTDGGGIVLQGTSKAWIALPAGYTLTAATAVISGTAGFFVLTHTCPAGSTTPTPTPSPSGSPSPSGTPTVTPSESPSGSSPGTGTPTPSETSTPTSSGSTPVTTPATSSSSSSGGLPTTGVALAGMVLTAGGLIALGTILLLARRRRTAADS